MEVAEHRVRVPVHRERDGRMPRQTLRGPGVHAAPHQEGNETVSERVEVEPGEVEIGRTGLGLQILANLPTCGKSNAGAEDRQRASFGV